MRHAPTSLRRFLAVLVALVALAAAVIWLLTRPAAAQPALPVLPQWQPGPRPATLGEPVTWWAESVAITPTVQIEGGAGGLSTCTDDGSGVTLRCVVWAQGDWRRVLADGATVAERSRLWLPGVRR